MAEDITVIIVEDEPLIAMDLATTLEDFGCVVTVAQDLATARAMTAKSVFQWAVLDLNLTDGSTLPLARGLRSQDTKIVFVSGTALDPDLLRDLDACQFPKPFEVDTVCAHITGG